VAANGESADSPTLDAQPPELVRELTRGGLYSGGMQARIGDVYVFLHNPGPAGTRIWDEDWGIKNWEDGQSWEYAGKDDDYGFRHFKASGMEISLKKKTWVEEYRQAELLPPRLLYRC
jgi:hypothetical protein